jgi:putative ABC transport system substrate-binding protein
VVGVLWHAANIAEETPYYQSLLEGFAQLGYVDERAITLEHRFPDEKPELFTSMAAELVAMKPDVVVGVGSAAPYLKKATSTIPMVFMYVPDPVGAGLVESVRRPGGNATGLTNFSVELSAKRLQYLKEIVPSLARVALLINPNAKISGLYVRQSEEAAPKLGLGTQVFEVRSLPEIDRAFDAMVKAGMQAVVVNAESLFYRARRRSESSRWRDIFPPAPGCGKSWTRARSCPTGLTSERSRAAWPSTSTGFSKARSRRTCRWSNRHVSSSSST